MNTKNLLWSLALSLLAVPAALAGPDCSPNLRAKTARQCESLSYEGNPSTPGKDCTWDDSARECTCCINNDAMESGSGDHSEDD